MESVVTSTGGSITKSDRMGKRHLAYRVGHFKEGNYVLFIVESEVATVKELERRLRVSEPVIKYLTVRVDEELKRAEKLRNIRAKRLAKKKPRPGSEPAAAASA